jgi:hypothetical protein
MLINACLVDVEQGRLVRNAALQLEKNRIAQVGPREAFSTELEGLDSLAVRPATLLGRAGAWRGGYTRRTRCGEAG